MRWQGQHLVIDADDTLWENNAYFEEAFDEFAQYLNHSRLTPVEVRLVLDEIELVNQKVHGYGSVNFGRNLQECYQRLCERHIQPEDLATVMRFAEGILERPIEVIDGVEETLAYLKPRHDLTLFTKGDADEQRLKVDRSGLAQYFHHIEVVREKDPAAYRQLAAERGFAPAKTWMVGNSPKSDINASLLAGLNAVYVPHARTWHLEKTSFVEGQPGQLIQVENFAGLRQIF